jgi:hypothetical protein
MLFIKEIWKFISIRKKFWLLPIILMLVVFIFLILLSPGSTSFNYTIF